MLIFTTTFLPINFCTRTPFIPWTPLPLSCLHLYCRNHLSCQHHIPLLILLCLITAQISVVTGVILVATGVPTTTVILTKTGANLLPTRGQTIGSRTCATQGLASGLDSSMSAANYAPISITQLPIFPSFAAVPSSSLLILLLGMFLLQLGSLTPAQINMSHLIL
jgi:hypothetical protein